jgi:hypothetical protein
MTRRLLILMAAACLITAIAALAATRKAAPPPGLAEADLLYSQKSYAKALEGYQHALQTGAAGQRRAEVEYRVAVCLGRTQRWDEAIARTQEFYSEHRAPLWAARGYHWLGQLLTVAPHCGYQVGKRIYRGQDYPKVKGPEKPEYVQLCEEDRGRAISSFEQAKKLYEQTRPHQDKEEADLNFDLASLLSRQDLGPLAAALIGLEMEKRPSLRLREGEPDPAAVKRLQGHDWALTPTKPYDPSQPFPQRILGLYLQIERLENGRRAPEARLARALYLRGYQGQMSELMQAFDRKKKDLIPIPFPYQDVDAIALLESIAGDFRKHPVAPQALYTAGLWLESKSEFLKALDRYQAVIERWPDSKWVSDAKDRIQDIEWPSLGISARPAQPGSKAWLSVSGRNVKTIKLTAYRVRLEEVLLNPAVLEDAHVDWGHFGVLGDEAGLLRYPREKVAEWTHVTNDTGDHRLLRQRTQVPLSENGAYVITADGGQAHAATLLLITDLAIVQKVDKDRALVFVCNAKTGQPVPGAEVLIREIYVTKRDQEAVSVERGQADQEGLKGKALVRPAGVSQPNSTIQALAWVGDRYALTGQMWHEGYRAGRRDEYRGHVTTDRPVYRPGQKVYFRAIILARTVEGEETPAGSWSVPQPLPFEVTVRDTRGEKVFQGTYTSNEFGAINGGFALGDEPALGVYEMNVRLTFVEPPFAQIKGNRFRVEEYKKPEFEVKVLPGAEQVRVGEQMTAKLQARYYFGAPVVGAKATYRVFRQPFFPSYRFPRPYDWLTGVYGGDEEERDYEGEVVKTGEGRTDAQGELSIALATDAGGQYPEARAYQYTVTAEVTDPSRRTIEGKGEVRASKQQFFASLDTKQGFYQSGDRIEVEVMTLDVMERPVSARGVMRVERVLLRGVPDEVTPPLQKQEIQTDKYGRAFFQWTCKEGGQYRFTFEAVDEWKQTVTGRTYTWVAGPGFDSAAPHLSGVQLIPQKRVYDEGDTCRLLVVSEFPESTVLLSQEGGNQTLGRAVLSLKGKSQVVEVKLHSGHLPNFRFSAAMIRNWQAYQSQVEVFVPPGKQFLDVSVTSDRAKYRPGEKATFAIKATDWRGQPARAEFSLGVVDASLFYIQSDYAGDIRPFFYGGRRYSEVPSTYSLHWSPGGASHTDRRRVAYKRHDWALPEDMGQLRQWPPGAGHLAAFLPSDVTDIIAYPVLNDVLATYVRDRDVWKAPSAGAFGGRGGGRGGGGMAGRAAGPPGRPGPQPALEEPAAVAASREAAHGVEPALAEAALRTQFADTAFWSPAVVTGEDGLATVAVTMPENLTTWKATVRGLTTQAQVGQASAECVTTKDLIIRLQAPRFFMERDMVALSANVHNYLDADKRVKVAIALDGGTLELVKEPPADLALKEPATNESLWVTVPKNSERRVDWVVRVLRSGTASVRMTAQTDVESDGVEMQFPVLVHGAEKFVVQSGVMRNIKGTQTATLTLDLPKERRRGATELNLQLTPSLAAITLDALPYLADYPYGCIEQTMSRFLPSVLVARTLRDLGVDLKDLRKRADAYAQELEAAAGSQPQAGSAYTYPKGMPGSLNAAELASRMYLRRKPGPIFDPARLDRMVKAGLRRIYSQQHSDGGWGWWQSDLSDPYMTAYVCYGLYTAREAGVQIDSNALERGFKFLLADLPEEDNLHRIAYLASVVSLRGSVDDKTREVIADRLWRNRIKLTPYSQALLALALNQIGEVDKARILVDNLENTAHIDEANGTCNWTAQGRWWWHWWDSPVETNAAVLRAILAVRPDSDLAPMIVKWMVNNRRGSHWQSTRETAMAVYALADYIRLTKDLAPDYTITVDLGGKVQRTYRVSRENALFFDNRFIVGDEVLGDGPQALTITVKGEGTLYYSAYLKYFSLEEDIKGAGNEIIAERRYFKLTPRLVDKKENGRTWQELTYDRKELASGARLESGDLIEVELVIESKNDYEYLVFEDMKPAGCEPVEVRSGEADSSGVYSYMELHDEKVAFFITDMPQGTRAVRYRMRAEIPGQFHALPTNGYAMYAPDVRCLSDEWRATIRDQ